MSNTTTTQAQSSDSGDEDLSMVDRWRIQDQIENEVADKSSSNSGNGASNNSTNTRTQQ